MARLPRPPTRHVVLPDGRRLTWVALGAHEGVPAFYLHGTPSSAVGALPLDGAAREAGVRLLAVNRPGIGGSSHHRHRTVTETSRDLVRLADHLGIGRAAVLGYSGGGPFALACGVVAPERFPVLHVVSGAGLPGPAATLDQVDATLVRFGRHAPSLGAGLVAVAGRVTGWFPHVAVRRWAADAPDPDRRALLDHPDDAAALMGEIGEALARSARGVLADEVLLAHPWDFAPEDVGSEVRWWHGTADDTVPLREARVVIDRLPRHKLTTVADTGHLMWRRVGAEVLADIADRSRAAPDAAGPTVAGDR